MTYQPFREIKEVEKFFNHSIYRNGIELIVVGANFNKKSNLLYIQAVNSYGEEFSMPAMDWFYSATYMGHNFGVEVKHDF